MVWGHTCKCGQLTLAGTAFTVFPGWVGQHPAAICWSRSWLNQPMQMNLAGQVGSEDPPPRCTPAHSLWRRAHMYTGVATGLPARHREDQQSILAKHARMVGVHTHRTACKVQLQIAGVCWTPGCGALRPQPSWPCLGTQLPTAAPEAQAHPNSPGMHIIHRIHVWRQCWEVDAAGRATSA